MKKKISIFCSATLFLMLINTNGLAQELHPKPKPVSSEKSIVTEVLSSHTLQFNQLAANWDEAIPLGNGMLGALIWQRDGQIRFSLDRADLWDMRPMKGLHRTEFSYQWVNEQVQKKKYDSVQKYFDAPYENEPAPSKIPGAAIEFNSKEWGNVELVYLSLDDAYCEINWANGVLLRTFVAANEMVGCFRFENLETDLAPALIAPKYQAEVKDSGDSEVGDDLSRLGYQPGTIKKERNSITYYQPGWGGFNYTVHVSWHRVGSKSIEGVWTITSQYPGKKQNLPAIEVSKKALSNTFRSQFENHKLWWNNFWNKSSVKIPNLLIENQWYLEQYKFGAASRLGAPPISLQAIWTADNGKLPPWKGDFHHDLNTQLSYWPAYSANHLEEAMPYLDHLDANKNNYKRYTKTYFAKEGLAVPGVTTLDGTEMGGWIQYSLSPTVSAWLAHHYYLQWRYGMDREFLRKRAYPWINETAQFLENITYQDESGHRKLPISSSPEINDNSIDAWFQQNTNYDLALMKFVFKAAAEMAEELGLKTEAEHWQKINSEFSGFAISPKKELMIAPGFPYKQSHRHFSNLMAIHPLGLIKWEDGTASQSIIKNSIHLLDSIGPAHWCGYSYAWLANLKARAKDGEGAANALQIFAKAFCSINSFHVNGDQTKKGYSESTDRPFTLEGNFAFAAGLQEMLLQSYAGSIEVFPAIPASWQDISFKSLRAEGAFLVSAKKENGVISEVLIVSEKGGQTKLKMPFKTWVVSAKKEVVYSFKDGYLLLNTRPGSSIQITNGYE